MAFKKLMGGYWEGFPGSDRNRLHPELYLDNPVQRHLIESLDAPDDIGQQIADQLSVSGLPECSIAASDAWDSANSFFESGIKGDRYSSRGLKLDQDITLAENGFISQESEVSWFRDEAKHIVDGYEVRLGLVRPRVNQPSKRRLRRPSEPSEHQAPLSMYAFVRGRVAFPVVHFGPSDQQWCKYLQFPGEHAMSELESQNFFGWGQDEHGSRLDTVQLIDDFLSGKTNDLHSVFSSIRLGERITSALGEHNPQVEEVIKWAFFQHMDTADYQHSYKDKKVGRVQTDLVVSGTLQEDAADPNRKYMRVSCRPESQPDEELLTYHYIFDKFAGVTVVDEAGEPSEVSPMQLGLIADLLRHPTGYPVWSRKERKLSVRNVSTFIGSFALVSSIQTGLAYLTDAELPPSPGTAAVLVGMNTLFATGTVYKENQERSKRPQANTIGSVQAGEKLLNDSRQKSKKLLKQKKVLRAAMHERRRQDRIGQLNEQLGNKANLWAIPPRPRKRMLRGSHEE